MAAWSVSWVCSFGTFVVWRARQWLAIRCDKDDAQLSFIRASLICECLQTKLARLYQRHAYAQQMTIRRWRVFSVIYLHHAAASKRITLRFFAFPCLPATRSLAIPPLHPHQLCASSWLLAYYHAAIRIMQAVNEDSDLAGERRKTRDR